MRNANVSDLKFFFFNSCLKLVKNEYIARLFFNAICSRNHIFFSVFKNVHIFFFDNVTMHVNAQRHFFFEATFSNFASDENHFWKRFASISIAFRVWLCINCLIIVFWNVGVVVMSPKVRDPDYGMTSTCKKRTDRNKCHMTKMLTALTRWTWKKDIHDAHETNKMSNAHAVHSMNRTSEIWFSNIYRNSKFFMNFVFNSIVIFTVCFKKLFKYTIYFFKFRNIVFLNFFKHFNW